MAAESSTSASGGSGGGVSAESYIGSLISLTSKSEIRYEGILYNINTEESSIGLRNVRSFGTEGRKKDGQQVPPLDKIYEYILFRGSDIKDLQVKASAPLPNSPPIISDPAIIQSHYPHPTTQPMNLAAPPSGSLGDQASHSAQMGLPGSTFQTGPPLYQHGANLNSWGPSPPNANNGGLPMPMYWQGFYGAPSGLPQMPQQTLLRPPPALSIPPSLQQMQFSGFNSSFPTASQGLPTNNLHDYQSSLVVNSTGTSTVTSMLPASTLSLNVPSLHQTGSIESGPMINQLQNMAPISSLSTSTPISSLPSLASLSTPVPASAGLPSVASKPTPLLGPSALPEPNSSQPRTSLIGTASPVLTETLTPSLVTQGQLLQSGIPTVSVSQPLQTTHKDVEVIQVSPKKAPETSAPAATEAQPPILPTPPSSRTHKPNGGAYHMRNNYRGRGGRGFGFSRPATKFTEDFDFTAMNEKFNKDEVWGHLGKKTQSKDKEGNEFASDGDDSQDENDAELPNVESKAVYNKDDFFDSLSCNALDNDPSHGRTRYSEQMKLDTETFGEFSRYRGGRGGRGYNRGGGGRFRGSYHGRGYGGYGYGNRGHGGRGMQNHS